ncbi:MAG: ATP-binding protein [Lachnospiraceae bacterium]|nr:ATP-binding protein [Lachnospiraceae bacterium]
MYCILVTGIPAAGKSVLAKRLSADMGLPWFSKDCIKEKLYDTLGFASREEKVRLGIASTEVLYYLAEQMMQCGKPFILENNFEASSRQGLVQLLERYGYRALTLRLTGDYARIYQRFAQRDKSSERHPGHVTNSRYFKGEGAAESQTITLEQYIAGIQSREMDSFSVDGPVITVDTTDFSKVDWERLYQEIKKCLSV